MAQNHSHLKQILAFDLYGTLLSTESIAKALGSHFGQSKADAIAASWRKYQLEYTWRLNSMNRFTTFSDVTRSSLQHALLESSESLSAEQTEDLMTAYDSLSTFPDVEPTLKALSSRSDVDAVVFSNGTRSMVSSSVHKSADLKPHSSLFKQLVTVEDPQRYKPHPDVYHHLAKQLGRDPSDADHMGAIWLVSGNPFDIIGARAVGLQAVWVDRAGNGWQDRLLSKDLAPTAIVKSLEEVIGQVTSKQAS